jgi:ribosomal protein S27E
VNPVLSFRIECLDCGSVMQRYMVGKRDTQQRIANEALKAWNRRKAK